MKHTVPTILAIAAFAPGLAALDVKDDDVKLGLTLQVQLRADVSSGETAYGQDFDVDSATAGTGDSSEGDPADFYLRRMRFGLKGTYKNDYKFSVVFSSDYAQAKDNAIGLYEAYVVRVWKDETRNLTHEFKAGQSNAFFNGAAGSYASASYLLPATRATEGLLTSRGNGIGYLLTAPVAKFGVDIQNNTGDAAGDNDGMFYSARVELTPPGELGIAKPQETFAGKSGTGVSLALDYGVNTRDANTTTTSSYGIELLGHMDALTALAEYRVQSVDNSNGNTAAGTLDSSVLLVQAGFALPLGDKIIEPAVRWSLIDAETDDEGANNFNTAVKKTDYGTSGNQYDLGVNYYISGFNNKVQVSYTLWEGVENNDGHSANAEILRAQWQLYF